jgi:hypothetical protein
MKALYQPWLALDQRAWKGPDDRRLLELAGERIERLQQDRRHAEVALGTARLDLAETTPAAEAARLAYDTARAAAAGAAFAELGGRMAEPPAFVIGRDGRPVVADDRDRRNRADVAAAATRATAEALDDAELAFARAQARHSDTIGRRDALARIVTVCSGQLDQWQDLVAAAKAGDAAGREAALVRLRCWLLDSLGDE